MSFDATISIGAIINLVSVLGTGFLILIGFHWRLNSVEGKLDSMKTVLETLARQDERLRSQEERLCRQERTLDDLRRGEGFILPIASRPRGDA